MGRNPRNYHPDGIYHLTTHGIDDHPIFHDDVDRQGFCIRFKHIVQSEGWDVYAACLMDTHYHLLLGPTLGRVSDGMKLLNGGHSRAFNKRHARRGALFESRYTDTTIRDEEHFRNTVRYIEENPIAAGMVESVAEWPWTTANPDSPLSVSDTLLRPGSPSRFEEVSDTFADDGACRLRVSDTSSRPQAAPQTNRCLTPLRPSWRLRSSPGCQTPAAAVRLAP